MPNDNIRTSLDKIFPPKCDGLPIKGDAPLRLVSVTFPPGYGQIHPTSYFQKLILKVLQNGT
jgi:hypothetical protein